MDKLILNFKAGQIPVSFDIENEVIWMKQNEPSFGQILDMNKIHEVLKIGMNGKLRGAFSFNKQQIFTCL